MTGSPDRQKILSLVKESTDAGARTGSAVQELGLSERTLRRWRRGGEDGRPKALRPRPRNALSLSERSAILKVCNTPENASKPPAQIVPELADQGLWLGSESTFYRVLRANGQVAHRGRARAPKSRPKATHTATATAQVWVWGHHLAAHGRKRPFLQALDDHGKRCKVDPLGIECDKW
jgi:hypothetical protein